MEEGQIQIRRRGRSGKAQGLHSARSKVGHRRQGGYLERDHDLPVQHRNGHRGAVWKSWPGCCGRLPKFHSGFFGHDVSLGRSTIHQERTIEAFEKQIAYLEGWVQNFTCSSQGEYG